MKKHTPSQSCNGKATRAAAIALAICSFSLGTAQAASAGSIVVYSHLSEPLNAVSVLGVGTAKGVSAKLASAEEYAARGAKRPAWADRAALSVRELDSGRLELRVTTSEPVEDPAASLIVNVAGLSGTDQIQYALMLDPASERPSISAEPREAANRALPPAGNARNDSISASAAPAKNMSVSHGQTLSAIARERKPLGVSVDRMMLGLLQANPRAFVDGNVNRLKAGAILKMPSSQELAAIGAGDAASKINEQAASFALWRSSKAPRLSTIPEGAKTAASVGEVGVQSSAAQSRDALRLEAANGQAESLVDGVAKRRESGEAKARIADLERARDELKTLAALSPPGKLSNGNAAEAVAKEEPPVASSPSTKPSSPAASGTAGKEAGLSTSKKPVPKVVPAHQPSPDPIQPPSFLGELWSQASGSASYLAALIAAVALAAAGLIARRKKAATRTLSGDAIERGEDLPPSQSMAEPHVEPTDLEHRLNAAETFEAFGQPENAKEAYEAVLKLHPGHLGALLGLAKIAHKADRKGELARLSGLIESSSGRVGPEWEAVRSLLALSSDTREAVKVASERRGASAAASAAVSAEFESGFAPQKQESLAPAVKEKAASFEFKLPSLGGKPDASGLRLAPLDLLDKDSNAQSAREKDQALGKSSGEILMELADTYLSVGDSEGAKAVLAELAEGEDPAMAELARKKMAKL